MIRLRLESGEVAEYDGARWRGDAGLAATLNRATDTAPGPVPALSAARAYRDAVGADLVTLEEPPPDPPGTVY